MTRPLIIVQQTTGDGRQHDWCVIDSESHAIVSKHKTREEARAARRSYGEAKREPRGDAEDGPHFAEELAPLEYRAGPLDDLR
jgi:hypothetical protein